MPDPKNEQDDDDRSDARKRDVPNLAEPPGSVDSGRFVQLRIDACHRSEKQYRAPAGVLPDGLQRKHNPEQRLVRQEVELFMVESDQYFVDDAVPEREEQERYADDDDPGQEVRQVDDRLHHPFIEAVANFVQHDGKHDRQRKEKHEIQKIDRERVAQQHHKIGIGEKTAEMVQPDPRTVQEALERGVLLERDQDAPHRYVAEQQKVQNAGQREQIQKFVPFDAFPNGSAARHQFGCVDATAASNHEIPHFSQNSPFPSRRRVLLLIVSVVKCKRTLDFRQGEHFARQFPGVALFCSRPPIQAIADGTRKATG